jgi:hypothetical protein
METMHRENGIMSVLSPPKTNKQTNKQRNKKQKTKNTNKKAYKKDSKTTTTRYFKYLQYLQMHLKAIKYLLHYPVYGQASF